MKKFIISYKNGDLVGFRKTEKYIDYNDAYHWSVIQNYYGVMYPEVIDIFEL